MSALIFRLVSFTEWENIYPDLAYDEKIKVMLAIYKKAKRNKRFKARMITLQMQKLEPNLVK